jgi:hypothetical protein
MLKKLFSNEKEIDVSKRLKDVKEVKESGKVLDKNSSKTLDLKQRIEIIEKYLGLQ